MPPPPGFDAKVLAAITPRPAGTTHSRWTWIAAAAVLVGVAGVGGFAIGSATHDEVTAPPGAPVLRTADGRAVGTVTRTELDSRPVVAVEVYRPAPGIAYTCRFVRADGSTVVAGRWTPPANGGLWLVSAPDDAQRLELVTDAGVVWSSTAL